MKKTSERLQVRVSLEHVELLEKLQKLDSKFTLRNIVEKAIEALAKKTLAEDSKQDTLGEPSASG